MASEHGERAIQHSWKAAEAILQPFQAAVGIPPALTARIAAVDALLAVVDEEEADKLTGSSAKTMAVKGATVQHPIFSRRFGLCGESLG